MDQEPCPNCKLLQNRIEELELELSIAKDEATYGDDI